MNFYIFLCIELLFLGLLSSKNTYYVKKNDCEKSNIKCDGTRSNPFSKLPSALIQLEETILLEEKNIDIEVVILDELANVFDPSWSFNNDYYGYRKKEVFTSTPYINLTIRGENKMAFIDFSNLFLVIMMNGGNLTFSKLNFLGSSYDEYSDIKLSSTFISFINVTGYYNTRIKFEDCLLANMVIDNSLYNYLYGTLLILMKENPLKKFYSIEFVGVTFNKTFFPAGMIKLETITNSTTINSRVSVNIRNCSFINYFSISKEPMIIGQTGKEFAIIAAGCEIIMEAIIGINSTRILYAKKLNSISLRNATFSNSNLELERPELLYFNEGNLVIFRTVSFIDFASASRDDNKNIPRDDILLSIENLMATGSFDDEKTQAVIKFVENNEVIFEELNIYNLKLVKKENLYFMFIGMVLYNKVEIQGSIIRNITLESNSMFGGLILIFTLGSNILTINTMIINDCNTNSYTLTLCLGAVVNNTIHLNEMLLETLYFRHKATQRDVLRFYFFVGEIGDKLHEFLLLRTEQIKISSFSAFLGFNDINVKKIIFKEIICLGNCFINAFVYNNLSVYSLLLENIETSLVSSGILLQNNNNLTLRLTQFGQSKSISGSLFLFVQNNVEVINCDFNLNAALSVEESIKTDERFSVAGSVYIGRYNNISIIYSNFIQSKCDLYGGAITIYRNNKVNISYCNFTNVQSTNRDSRGGAIFVFSFNEIKIKSTTFLENLGFHGGVFYLTFNNILDIFKSVFRLNFAWTGGVAILDANNIAILNGLEFSSNEANKYGVIYNKGGNNTLRIFNSKIFNNKANLRDSLFSFETEDTVVFENVSVDYSQSGISSFIFANSSVKIYLINSNIKNATDLYSVFRLQEYCLLNVSDSKFSSLHTYLLQTYSNNFIILRACHITLFNASNQNAGLILIVSENQLILEKNVISFINGNDGAILSSNRVNTIEVYSCSFHKVKSANPGSWITLNVDNYVFVFNSSFNRFDNTESTSVFLKIISSNLIYFDYSNFTGMINNLGENAAFINVLSQKNVFSLYVCFIHLNNNKNFSENTLIFIKIVEPDNLIKMSFSNITLENFLYGVQIFKRNQLRVIRCFITNSYLTFGYFHLVRVQSILWNSCVFYNNLIAKPTGYFIELNNCTSSYIRFVESKNGSKLIFCTNSFLNIARSIFSFLGVYAKSKPEFYFENSYIELYRTDFHMMNNIETSNIIVNRTNILVKSNEFLLNKGVKGGVFYLVAAPYSFFLLNKFLKNQGVLGGVIYSEETLTLELSLNDFIQNQASRWVEKPNDEMRFGLGACIYFHYDLNEMSKKIFYYLSSNSFAGNSADVGGVYYFRGANFLKDLKDCFAESYNRYYKNKAKKYGPIYSSSIFKVIPDKDIKRSTESMTRFEVQILDDILMNDDSEKCYLKLFCIDYFGQAIIGFPYILEINLIFDQDFLAVLKSMQYYLCLSEVRLLYDEKRFRFFEEKYSRIFFTSRSFVQNLTEQADRILEDQNFTIYFKMKYCQLGEYLDSQDMICKPCQINFYSFKSNIQRPSTCINCESLNFFCYGGSNLSPKRGFWRLDSYSKKFLKCPLREACLGDINMVHSDSTQITGEKFELTNPSGICAFGYRGALCSLCMEGFSKSDDKKCSRCGNGWTIFLYILKLILKLLIFGYMIYTAIILGKKLREKAADKNLVLSNFLIKILIGHFQFIRLIFVIFSIDYGEFAIHSLSFITSIISLGPDLSMSLDCLNIKLGIPTKYIQSLFVLAIPIVAVYVVKYFHFSTLRKFIYFLICKKRMTPSRSRSKSKFLSHLIKFDSSWISIFIICVMLSFDSIAIDLMEYFPEINIGDENNQDFRLIADLQIEATQSKHIKWKNLFVTPALIIYVAGIPFLIFYKIFKMKKLLKLHDPRTLFRYGYFYFAYNEKYYFYELVYILRKMIIIIIDVFIARLFQFETNFNAITYLIILMIFFMIAAAFSRFYKPFNNEKYKLLNNIEYFSFISQASTCSIGCLSLSLKMENLETSSRISETLRRVFLLIGTFINLIFIFHWCYHYWKIQAKPTIMGMLGSIRKMVVKTRIFKYLPRKIGYKRPPVFMKMELAQPAELSLRHINENLIHLKQLNENILKLDGVELERNESAGNTENNQINEELLLKLLIKENKKLKIIIDKMEAEIKKLKFDQVHDISITQEGVTRKTIHVLKEKYPSKPVKFKEFTLLKENENTNYQAHFLKSGGDAHKIVANHFQENIDTYSTEFVGTKPKNYRLKIDFTVHCKEEEEVSKELRVKTKNEGLVAVPLIRNINQNDNNSASVSVFIRCFHLLGLTYPPELMIIFNIRKKGDPLLTTNQPRLLNLRLCILDFFIQKAIEPDQTYSLRNGKFKEEAKILRSYSKVEMEKYKSDVRKLKIKSEPDSHFCLLLTFMNDDYDIILFNKIIEPGESKTISLYTSREGKLEPLYCIFQSFLSS